MDQSMHSSLDISRETLSVNPRFGQLRPVADDQGRRRPSQCLPVATVYVSVRADAICDMWIDRRLHSVLSVSTESGVVNSKERVPPSAARL